MPRLLARFRAQVLLAWKRANTHTNQLAIPAWKKTVSIQIRTAVSPRTRQLDGQRILLLTTRRALCSPRRSRRCSALAIILVQALPFLHARPRLLRRLLLKVTSTLSSFQNLIRAHVNSRTRASVTRLLSRLSRAALQPCHHASNSSRTMSMRTLHLPIRRISMRRKRAKRRPRPVVVSTTCSAQATIAFASTTL